MKKTLMTMAMVLACLYLPAQNVMKIAWLEPSPVVIGGKTCQKGDFFSPNDIVEWSVPEQTMKVRDTVIGTIKVVSAEMMNRSGYQSIVDLVSGSSKRLSARSADGMLAVSSPVKTEKTKQNGSYEAWAKKKQDEYDKWKKMRTEIAGHLPNNPNADKISSFIDAGFETVKQPATVATPQQPTTVPAQSAVTVPAQQPATVVTPQASATVPAQSAPPVAAQPSVSQPISVKIKVWVVIAGIGSYADCCRPASDNNAKDCRNLTCLNYTNDDAYRMYAFYKSPEGGSLPDKQIRLLIDEDATRDNVLTALNDVFSKAGKDDAVVFYFSGHGSSSAFVAQDCNTAGRGLLEHEKILEIFDRSPARCKYIIADACHSGNLAKNNKYYSAFDKNKSGFVMLLSSMGDEYSAESNGIRQGIFSYFLLRGLKGEADTNGDNLVSIVELFEFVKAGVTHYTRNRQNPILVGNYENELPVSVIF